ncbi:MAG: flagellar biosynthesis anti-sigma factor FlgM [Selenomonadaceae bacterium]|nr:flagellar biosynthesis anti-sigma factor FlgM [Selenomonadaceae bacterium]
MIINNNIQAAASLYNRTWSNGSKTRTGEYTRPQAGDEVVLSGNAKTFSNALRDLRANADSDGVRMDKVEKFTALIESGCYHIDSDRLAESIMNYKF